MLLMNDPGESFIHPLEEVGLLYHPTITSLLLYRKSNPMGIFLLLLHIHPTIDDCSMHHSLCYHISPHWAQVLDWNAKIVSRSTINSCTVENSSSFTNSHPKFELVYPLSFGTFLSHPFRCTTRGFHIPQFFLIFPFIKRFLLFVFLFLVHASLADFACANSLLYTHLIPHPSNMDVDAGLLSAKFFEDDPEESEDDLEGDPESFNFSTSALPSAEPCAVPNYTPAPIHQQIREVGIFLNNKRRATAQQTLLGGATAWVDQDDSGTYDPKLERKTPPLRKKAKRRRPAEGLGEDGNSKQRKRKRTTEYAGLITFNFTNQKALDYLRSISPGPFSDNSEESTLGTDGEDDLSGSGAFGRGKRVRQAKKSDEISTRFVLRLPVLGVC